MSISYFLARIKRTVQMLLALVFILASGCKSGSQHDSEKNASPASAIENNVTIYLYEGFPLDKALMIKKEIGKYFDKVDIMKQRLPLPEEAYVEGRNRYRGTGLLDDLKPLRKGGAVLGLTDRIICTKNELSPNFGIMGISYLRSGLAVASNKIPKNGRIQKDANLVKLTLHELGHAYGLPHCSDQKCYMVDAEHRMKLPQTTGFCEKCSRKLKNKGLR